MSAASPLAGSPTAAGNALNFSSIRLNGGVESGQFRAMNERFGWRVKRAKQQKTFQFEAAQVAEACWIQGGAMGREYTLRVILKNNTCWRFDNFREGDFVLIEKHIAQHWKGVSLAAKKADLSGRSWGLGNLERGRFELNSLEDPEAPPKFEFPLTGITRAMASKGDVQLTFAVDENRLTMEDCLTDLRLYIPPAVREEGAQEVDFAEDLKNRFLRESGLSTTDSTAVCIFQDVKVLIPAGRFDLCLHRSTIQLKGRSSDFVIENEEITRMYLLRNPSMPHTNIVMTLKSPLRKGRTAYQHVILQFDDKVSIELPVDLKSEEFDSLAEAKEEQAVEPVTRGPICAIARRMLSYLLGKTPVEPSELFKSATGHPCVRCSYKAESGHFYLLSRSFIFIPKPVLICGYDEIASVSLGRTSGSQTKFFELDIHTKAGATLSFSSVDRQEASPLTDFLLSQQIKVLTLARDEGIDKEGKSILDRELPSDDSDDEDFQAATSEDDDDASLEDEDGEEEEEALDS